MTSNFYIRLLFSVVITFPEGIVSFPHIQKLSRPFADQLDFCPLWNSAQHPPRLAFS